MSPTSYCAHHITKLLAYTMLLISFNIDYKFIKFDSMGSSNGNFDIPLLKITNKSKNADPAV